MQKTTAAYQKLSMEEISCFPGSSPDRKILKPWLITSSVVLRRPERTGKG